MQRLIGAPAPDLEAVGRGLRQLLRDVRGAERPEGHDLRTRQDDVDGTEAALLLGLVDHEEGAPDLAPAVLPLLRGSPEPEPTRWGRLAVRREHHIEARDVGWDLRLADHFVSVHPGLGEAREVAAVAHQRLQHGAAPVHRWPRRGIRRPVRTRLAVAYVEHVGAWLAGRRRRPWRLLLRQLRGAGRARGPLRLRGRRDGNLVGAPVVAELTLHKSEVAAQLGKLLPQTLQGHACSPWQTCELPLELRGPEVRQLLQQLLEHKVQHVEA
mmetsp:Transcript_28621/g.90564  ORF Transcript_28621/g.90564 Transcript_28621/m.90564 type:complete len:269 (+) Transcript_28621:1746-2552(+)